jgi:hypothetical protein
MRLADAYSMYDEAEELLPECSVSLKIKATQLISKYSTLLGLTSTKNKGAAPTSDLHDLFPHLEG